MADQGDLAMMGLDVMIEFLAARGKLPDMRGCSCGDDATHESVALLLDMIHGAFRSALDAEWLAEGKPPAVALAEFQWMFAPMMKAAVSPFPANLPLPSDAVLAVVRRLAGPGRRATVSSVVKVFSAHGRLADEVHRVLLSAEQAGMLVMEPESRDGMVLGDEEALCPRDGRGVLLWARIAEGVGGT